MFRVGKHQGCVLLKDEDVGRHLQELWGCLGDGSGRRADGEADGLLAIGIEGEEGLKLLDGGCCWLFFPTDRLALGVREDAMGINGQDLSRIMAQGLPELSEHHLDSLCLGDAMGVEQMVDGGVTDHEGQSVGHFEALLTQRPVLPFARKAQSGFVDQLQGHPGFYMAAGSAGPATQQIPGAQAQMFGCKEPDTHEVAGDLVAQQLPDLAFDAALVTGLNATSGLCSLRFDAWKVGCGKRKMEFFFGARIR